MKTLFFHLSIFEFVKGRKCPILIVMKLSTQAYKAFLPVGSEIFELVGNY